MKYARRHASTLVAGILIALSATAADTPFAPASPSAGIVACSQCGIVDNIREVAQEGETTGIGTVAGGLLGGLLGRQLAEGGSTLGMLIGIAGGAYAGNKFEQYRNRTSRYEVSIRMDDGTQRLLTYDSKPTWHIGERINLGTPASGYTPQPEESRQPFERRMAYGTAI